MTSNAVSELHLTYAATHYGVETSDGLAEMVCNRGAVLPERGEEPAFHMPCVWLGKVAEPISFDEAVDVESAIEINRRRLNLRVGVKRVKYLIILPFPEPSDIDNLTAVSEDTAVGRFVRESLETAGIDLDDCLVTHLCRSHKPTGQKSYSDKIKTDNAFYLEYTIAAASPKVMIWMGADVAKKLTGRSLENELRGQVVQYSLPDGRVIPAIATVSPYAFLTSHANLSVFREELARAKQLGDGGNVTIGIQTDYVVIDTPEALGLLVDRIVRSVDPAGAQDPRLAAWVAFDTEFGNDVGNQEYRYTISAQLCWAPGKAAYIRFRRHEEVPAREETVYGKIRKDGTRSEKVVTVKPPDRTGVRNMTEQQERACWEAIARLFGTPGVRMIGQHNRVDVEQARRAGVDLDHTLLTGFDCMLAHHALYGDEDQGLDHLVRKYLPEVGPFWADLEGWLGRNGRTARLRFGYRDIPESILIPYAVKDADTEYRVGVKLMDELYRNERLWSFYWNHLTHTSHALIDLERKGILVDEDARMRLRAAYEPVYQTLLDRLRARINWPDFNPSSGPLTCLLLFGTTQYRGRDDSKVPEGVRRLTLTPQCNTDKYPRAWGELGDEARYHSPCVKAKVLDVMLTDWSERHRSNPTDDTEYAMFVLRYLKLISAVGKLLSTYLGVVEVNEFGVPEGGSSFHNNIWNDGRVRTHISQITETGRHSSKSANLQTNPKKQEAVLFEAMVEARFPGCSVKQYRVRTDDGETGPDGSVIRSPYVGPDRIEPADRIVVQDFKSIYVAPDQYCLVEADFKTAELFVWAYLSGDPALIDIMDKGRDLHSEVAATAFKLPPASELPQVVAALEKGDSKPYKRWNDNLKAKYGPSRIVAKSVNFGVPYGRQAPALAREISAQGVPTSVQQAEAIVKGLADQYPLAIRWLEDGATMAVRQEYIDIPGGRRRYFQGARSLSRSVQSAVGREAKNCRIQGTVAYLLDRSLINFRNVMGTAVGRRLGFSVLLPIHDAILFEVLRVNYTAMCKLIEHCMSTINCLPGLPGKRLGVDISEPLQSWGDH